MGRPLTLLLVLSFLLVLAPNRLSSTKLSLASVLYLLRSNVIVTPASLYMALAAAFAAATYVYFGERPLPALATEPAFPMSYFDVCIYVGANPFTSTPVLCAHSTHCTPLNYGNERGQQAYS